MKFTETESVKHDRKTIDWFMVGFYLGLLIVGLVFWVGVFYLVRVAGTGQW